MAALATVAQRSERPILSIQWTHADGSTGEDLDGATLTGYILDMETGVKRPILGALVVVEPAAAGVFTWQPDPADVANAGAHKVQFQAVFGTEPDPARTIVFEWEIAPSIVPA